MVDIDNKVGGNILINGTIENPIGTTSIVAPAGNVLATNDRDVLSADNHKSLIRTHILHIATPAGFVGEEATRVNVDVVDSKNVPLATAFPTACVNCATDVIEFAVIHALLEHRTGTNQGWRSSAVAQWPA